jgi:N-acetylgalactosamine-N,N'-diacetylbacillosaminyl-diphospho-undecaprenol 4-alpha-N-acetylgalactosaminyltransferase
MSVRVDLLVNSMAAGGAQRTVLSLLDRYRDHPRYRGRLVLLERRETYAVPDGTETLLLNPRRDGREGGVRKAIDLPVLARRYRADCRIRGTRAVLSFLERGNYVALTARGRGDVFGVVACECTDPGKAYGRGIAGRFNRGMIRLLYPKADRIVVKSSATRDDLSRTFGVPPERIAIVPNACDVDGIRRLAALEGDPPFPGADSSPVVVGVGRLVPLKRWGDLIDAVARVRRSVPCRLVLVGEGPEREFLSRRAMDHGFGADIAFTGWRENPFPLIARADVLALCSSHEGFPNVLLEAMACRCPSIASDSGATGEILKDGAGGLLYPVGDIPGLAAAILDILRNRSLREGLVSAGSLRVRDFSPEKILPLYDELLVEVLRSLGKRYG